MNNIDTTTKHAAFRLKGTLFSLTATVLQLYNTDVQAFTEQLDEVIQQAPHFFRHAPIVIDLQPLQVPLSTQNLQQLLHLLRLREIVPLGVRGADEKQQQIAKALGLIVFNIDKTEQLTTEDKPNTTANKPKQNDAKNTNTLLIKKPVRSGQQVYAKHGDLIVLAPVSEGAELLADGNIHVYGPLRGRALAGIQGNTQARIFCKSMEAELIAIAGHYMVNETLSDLEKNQAKQIYLENGKLLIREL